MRSPRPRRSHATRSGWTRKGSTSSDLDSLLSELELDRSVPPVPLFRGGTAEAKARLRHFLRHRLEGYAEQRNRPETDQRLPHEQVSALRPDLAGLRGPRRSERPPSREEERATYLEELVVRRELAHNFVHFTEHYDRYTGLPEWARATLDAHRERPASPALHQGPAGSGRDRGPLLERGDARDAHTGYMHNHMRMYWGKKILEWSRTPEAAYRVALELNNRYFLDGRDPASYANVGWIFGLHDRPWPGRAVYGNVRSMTAGGLERKADMAAYIGRVDELVRDAQES